MQLAYSLPSISLKKKFFSLGYSGKHFYLKVKLQLYIRLLSDPLSNDILLVGGGLDRVKTRFFLGAELMNFGII